MLTAYSYSSKNGNLSRKNEKEQIDYYTYPHILLEQLRSACLLVGAPSPKRPSRIKNVTTPWNTFPRGVENVCSILLRAKTKLWRQRNNTNHEQECKK
jgi:hypothetical protein